MQKTHLTLKKDNSEIVVETQGGTSLSKQASVNRAISCPAFKDCRDLDPE